MRHAALYTAQAGMWAYNGAHIAHPLQTHAAARLPPLKRRCQHCCAVPYYFAIYLTAFRACEHSTVAAGSRTNVCWRRWRRALARTTARGACCGQRRRLRCRNAGGTATALLRTRATARRGGGNVGGAFVQRQYRSLARGATRGITLPALLYTRAARELRAALHHFSIHLRAPCHA